MSQEEYFAKHTSACNPARAFCAKFQTMRDAWLSNECEVPWMMLAIRKTNSFKPQMVEFAKFCADQARNFANSAPRSTRAAAAADAAAAYAAAAAAAYAADAAAAIANGDAAAYAAAAAAARQSQREKLRELLPTMFLEASP